MRPLSCERYLGAAVQCGAHEDVDSRCLHCVERITLRMPSQGVSSGGGGV